MEAQFVGYRSFTSQKGATWYVLNFLIPFTQQERKAGLFSGANVASYWMDHPVKIPETGKKCKLYFIPNGSGRAQLDDIEVLD